MVHYGRAPGLKFNFRKNGAKIKHAPITDQKLDIFQNSYFEYI